MTDPIEITTHTDHVPLARFVLVAVVSGLLIAAGIHALTKLPEALAAAAQQRALIPGNVAYQDEIHRLDLENRTANQLQAQATAARWETVKRGTLNLAFTALAFTALTSAALTTVEKTAQAKRTRADLKLYQHQRALEAENPVHTPTGYELTQYTQNGLTFTHCKLTGLTIRADDLHANQVLAKQRAPLIAGIFAARIAAERDVQIAQANRPDRRPIRPQPTPWSLP